MSYFTKSDITIELPTEFLTEGLDDNADGAEDPGLWDALVASASRRVDSRLGQRYHVPFTGTIPALVKEAAIIFALDILYRRRGYGTEESNPWMTASIAMEKKLTRIGNDEEPLTPTKQEARPSVSAITEPARTTSHSGYLST